MFGKSRKQSRRVLDVMHGHCADNQVKTDIQRLLGNILADGGDFSVKLGFCRQLVQHRRRGIDCGDISHARRDMGCQQPGPCTKIHNVHVTIQGDVFKDGGADRGGKLQTHLVGVPVTGFFFKQVRHHIFLKKVEL